MMYNDRVLSLSSNVADDIRRRHAEILCSLEVVLGQHWRIIVLREHCSSLYDATLKTRQAEHPEYILGDIESSYRFAAIEDGPRETTGPNGSIIVIPRAHMQGTAKLTSDGKLRITECRVDMPR